MPEPSPKPLPQTALQDRFAPGSICFGCGPANDRGLRIKSHVAGSEVVAHWQPEPHHEAFEGVLNGGIAAALLDCHCNWTAAYHIMCRRGVASPPTTVTADFQVQLTRPTPVGAPVTLRARPVELDDQHAIIEAELEAGGKVCARFRGRFVAVKPGHPAYDRW